VVKRFLLYLLLGLLVGAAGLVGLSYYAGTSGPLGFLFPAEPQIEDITELSSADPRRRLPELLRQDWDYVCFVTPYYDLKTDPVLSGADIPWISDDGVLTVVLATGETYDLHKIDRSDVVEFRLEGLPEGEVCYDSTDLVLEYVDGEGAISLRVLPQQ
jgi:hypothetical protein